MLFERGTASLVDVREGEPFTLAEGEGGYERPNNAFGWDRGTYVHLKRGTVLVKGPQVEVENNSDSFNNHWFARCAVMQDGQVVGYLNVDNSARIHFEAGSKAILPDANENEAEIAEHWNQLTLRHQAGLLGVYEQPSWDNTYVSTTWDKLPEDEQSRLRPQIERLLQQVKLLESLPEAERFSLLVQQARKELDAKG